MGFPWRNWTILPFLSLPFEIFLLLLLVHYTYHTLCLLWHVIQHQIRNVAYIKSVFVSSKEAKTWFQCHWRSSFRTCSNTSHKKHIANSTSKWVKLFCKNKYRWMWVATRHGCEWLLAMDGLQTVCHRRTQKNFIYKHYQSSVIRKIHLLAYNLYATEISLSS